MTPRSAHPDPHGTTRRKFRRLPRWSCRSSAAAHRRHFRRRATCDLIPSSSTLTANVDSNSSSSPTRRSTSSTSWKSCPRSTPRRHGVDDAGLPVKNAIHRNGAIAHEPVFEHDDRHANGRGQIGQIAARGLLGGWPRRTRRGGSLGWRIWWWRRRRWGGRGGGGGSATCQHGGQPRDARRAVPPAHLFGVHRSKAHAESRDRRALDADRPPQKVFRVTRWKNRQ